MTSFFPSIPSHVWGLGHGSPVLSAIPVELRGYSCPLPVPALHPHHCLVMSPKSPNCCHQRTLTTHLNHGATLSLPLSSLCRDFWTGQDSEAIPPAQDPPHGPSFPSSTTTCHSPAPLTTHPPWGTGHGAKDQVLRRAPWVLCPRPGWRGVGGLWACRGGQCAHPSLLACWRASWMELK